MRPTNHFLATAGATMSYTTMLIVDGTLVIVVLRHVPLRNGIKCILVVWVVSNV
jgi:hypothetical protein